MYMQRAAYIIVQVTVDKVTVKHGTVNGEWRIATGAVLTAVFLSSFSNGLTQ